MKLPPVLDVVSAKLVGPFSLLVRFNDGLRKQVNVKPLLRGPVFEPLHDPREFAKVRVSRAAGTVVWPNDVDLAPSALYNLPDEVTGERHHYPPRAQRRVTPRRRTRSRS